MSHNTESYVGKRKNSKWSSYEELLYIQKEVLFIPYILTYMVNKSSFHETFEKDFRFPNLKHEDEDPKRYLTKRLSYSSCGRKIEWKILIFKLKY